MEISITMLKSMIEQVYKIIAKKYINYKKRKNNRDDIIY